MVMFSQCTAIVEVTNYESLHLWQEWHQQKGYTWLESRSGPLVTVGYVGLKPVCIAPLVHIVNGVSVLFVETTSIVVDWNMIENWLVENVPNAVNEEGYLNKTDAMNFHSIVFQGGKRDGK